MIKDSAAAGCTAEQEAVAINVVREFQNKQYASGAEDALYQHPALGGRPETCHEQGTVAPSRRAHSVL